MSSDPWARPDPAAGDADPRSAGDGGAPENGSGSRPDNGHAPDPELRELAAAFGRPSGIATSFVVSGSGGSTAPAPPPAPPSTALVAAFGRPDADARGLQRPEPAGGSTDPWPTEDEAFWEGRAAARDPWRDPGATVALGGPAYAESEPSEDTRGAGPRLSVRDVLLGGRIAPTALVVLGLVALLIGSAGGVLGWVVAGGADRLTDPGASLAQVAPGIERPVGSVAAIAGRTVPAVVSIEVRSGTTGGTGSGVVLDERGDIVTNNHVVALAATDPRATLEAVFASGARAPARVVGRDPQTDLAVVKVDLANPVVAQLGRSGTLQVGDGVIAIGSPLGLAGTVTEGIVSSLRRPVRLDAESSDANPVIDAIQTDAAINPGNSGGALVDSTGAVVGINTAIRTLGGGGEGGSIGLGFAIPIDDVREIAESLIRTGGYAHPDLGVNAKSVTDGTSDGAQVLNVRQGGVASRAGVVEGDVVTRVDDRSIGSADELVVAVRGHRPGDQVTLTVIRQGRPLTLQVTL